MKKIAIFASGAGTNMQAIADYFLKKNNVVVDLVLSNNSNAFVLQRAKNMNIEYIVFNKDVFYNSKKILDILINRSIDFIVLAGFMWLVPKYLIEAFPKKIINIHPALLPKYGGKGMYGYFVHKAVIDAKEKKSGITIHYVNEQYDEGAIIFQAQCDVTSDDTPETLAEKIHLLEHTYYPKIIEQVIFSNF